MKDWTIAFATLLLIGPKNGVDSFSFTRSSTRPFSPLVRHIPVRHYSDASIPPTISVRSHSSLFSSSNRMSNRIRTIDSNSNNLASLSFQQKMTSRTAISKTSTALASMFLGKEFSTTRPAGAISNIAVARPAAIGAVRFRCKQLAALSVGTTAAVAALAGDQLANGSSGKELDTSKRKQKHTKKLQSISKQAVLTTRKLKLVARTVQRMLRILYLGTPIVLWYPFAKQTPKSYDKWLRFFLRQSERGGAVVIKLCQWASSRPDIFGTEFCDVTKRLQDGTTPHAWSYTQQIMETNYGPDWNERFDLNPTVLGSGCIAQVYKGNVIQKTEGGSVETKKGVAIKVVHPNVRDGIEHDLNILRFLAGLLERLPFGYGERLEWNNLSGNVKEFGTMLIPQLNLQNEAKYIEKFNENFKDYPHVVFPKLVDGFESHPDVLVETFCEGVPVERFTKENADNKELRAELCDRAAHIMCTMIFEHNFVHGDLHPGNIFVNKDKKLVLLDCGIVNEYDNDDHDAIVNIIAAFIRMDGRKAAELMASDSNRRLEGTDGPQNIDEYIAKIEELSKTPRKSDFLFEKITTYTNYIFNAAATHHVKMNPSFISMCLAVKVQEGVALMLNPTCELIKIANPIILRCEANRLNKGMADRVKQYADDWIRKFKVKMIRENSKNEEEDLQEVRANLQAAAAAAAA